MRLKELLRDVAVCRCVPDVELEIPHLTNDTRKVQKGSLFAAIRGSRRDGNAFIEEALARGAGAVLTAVEPREGVPCILVEDEELAWALICRNFYGRPDEEMKIIGVTGTNGKTSVTMLLKQILEQVQPGTVGLIGTTGNYIGDTRYGGERTTPDALELYEMLRRMADGGCRYTVMEVSSHALARQRVGGIRFAAGGFTNLTEDHLDFHRTMEDYAGAKAALFRWSECGVFNADDPWAAQMAMETPGRALMVGTGECVDLAARDIRLDAGGVSFTAVTKKQRVPVFVPIPGRFTVSNALVALGLALTQGISLEEGARVLGSAKGVPGRMEVVPTPGKEYTVLIDYAHTPDALEKLLLSVGDFCRGRILLVFGCGGDRDRGKRPVMGAIGAALADVAILTSDNPRSEDPGKIIAEMVSGVENGMENVTIIENRRKAIGYAMDIGEKNDIIILAGKGHETTQEILGVRHHLDERGVVRGKLTETEDRHGNHYTEAGGRLVRREDRSEIRGGDLPGGLQ